MLMVKRPARARSLLIAALATVVLTLPVAAAGPAKPAPPPPEPKGPARFDLVEATISDMLEALKKGLLTSEKLVRMYLARIDAYDNNGPKLNSYLTINQHAVEQARALDQHKHPGPSKNKPLYGIPIALKDNVDTADMPTTAGSMALEGSIPYYDAFITRKLRDAGAVILGKLTLTEFANFLTNGMPGGYSGLGGYGFNPYDPRPLPGGDGRPVLSPSGSSSGSGIAPAANLAAAAIGTETSGSILGPGGANGIVGIKPTVGLVSRSGIIPITADQDTAGPLARTVTDAAIVLGVIAGFDPADFATGGCLTPGRCFKDYTKFLDRKALRGARIASPPTTSPIVLNAIDVLRSEGAYVEMIPALAGVNVPSILGYGFKRDLNAYLATLPPEAPVHSLAQVIAANLMKPGAIKYGQTTAVNSQAIDISPGSAATATYLTNYANGIAASRGILDGVYNGADGVPGTSDDFDALLNPGAGTPARAGYPSIVVPGGFLPAEAPVVNPRPSGITFSGPAWSEPRLIALGYAFEQATKYRRPPASTPPLPSDSVVKPPRRGGWAQHDDADD